MEGQAPSPSFLQILVTIFLNIVYNSGYIAVLGFVLYQAVKRAVVAGRKVEIRKHKHERHKPDKQEE